MGVLRWWLFGLVAAAVVQERFDDEGVAPRRGGRGVAPVLREGEDPQARFAEMHLMRGMALQAAAAANKCLEERPDAHACMEVLGRAAAQAGNCGKAMEALKGARSSASWSSRAATAEGLCHVKMGALDEALAAYDEAAWLNPLSSDPWVQRGLVNARLLRPDEVEHDLRELLDRDPEPWQIDLLELWRAHAADDPLADAILHQYEVRPPTLEERGLTLHLALVACERWIAVGDPTEALARSKVGVEVSRGHVRLTACRAEAVRREGDPYLAEAMIVRPWNQGRDTPMLDAVLARALVDQGRLDEAAALADTLADPYDPVSAATIWYLARARGDAVLVARTEQRLATLGMDVRAWLDALDPITGGR